MAELVKMRWRDWRVYSGANGQSALAEMVDFTVALTLDEYIRFYNERRKKQSLGWMSPMQYRISKGLAA